MGNTKFILLSAFSLSYECKENIPKFKKTHTPYSVKESTMYFSKNKDGKMSKVSGCLDFDLGSDMSILEPALLFLGLSP